MPTDLSRSYDLRTNFQKTAKSSHEKDSPNHIKGVSSFVIGASGGAWAVCEGLYGAFSGLDGIIDPNNPIPGVAIGLLAFYFGNKGFNQEYHPELLNKEP